MVTKNRKIKDFTLDVQVKDSGIFIQKYDSLVREFINSMRDRGYVPMHDLAPRIVVVYDKDKSVFDYAITVYGIYMGKKKSWEYEGVINGMIVPRVITQDKSKPQLKD